MYTNRCSANSLILCLLLASGIFVLTPGCKSKENPEPPTPTDSIGSAAVWLTRGDKSQLFSNQGNLTIKKKSSLSWPVIEIDTSQKFQEIDGFGAALTGSSAYLLNQKLDAASRAAVLKDLFDAETGIGISYLRITIGASDFSLSNFTYDDIAAGETDFELQNFSLDQDLQDVVPVLKEIIQVSPEIKLVGSPWSPPAWMKTNGSMMGGQLKTECYDVYSDYFVKYIQAMKNQGIVIGAVTPQNEPLYSTASYPCMSMTAAEQLDFIKNHMGPKFQAAGLDTRIIIYDHNWDNTEYAISILNDPDAKQYIAGSAFHAYAGYVSAMSAVHAAAPDRGLYFTEISGGDWATDFSANLMWNMENIFIGTTLNWSKSVLLWNLALNTNSGPTNNGCSDCRGVLTLNEANGQVTKNEEYYSIAHFSKFVRPGAVRVAQTIPQSMVGIGSVAFLNTDGAKCLVVSNYGSANASFTVNQAGKYFSYSLSPKSVVSITW